MALALDDRVLLDLSKSGLEPPDMNIRPLDQSERAATNVQSGLQGYVIPYFNISGKPIGFYRVRLFDVDPKYRQVKDTSNHIYFPKAFLDAQEDKKYVIITEGEKKAALLCKLGIPAVGLGGVDSWRNRIVTLPAETALSAGTKKGQVQARLPQGGEAAEDYDAQVAAGFQDLLDHLARRDQTAIILFDSDQAIGVKSAVQRAAATLGYELRFRGIPFNKIRQIHLPKIVSIDYKSDKVAVDDYLQHHPLSDLELLIAQCMAKTGAFPRHPSVRDYINKRLQKTKLSRKETQNVGLAILSDLDANGLRLRSPSDLTYYFDHHSKKLLRSAWATRGGDDQFDSPFTQFLYKRYGLSSADNRLLVWLGAQFTSEDPIENVAPHRIFAKPAIKDDKVYMQISDSEYVCCSAEGLTVHANGTGGILFESDQVEPLDPKRLLQEFALQSQSPLRNWWGDTLSEVRLRDKERQRVATALLYYMSPFLHRWRGMQLPVELIIGESGSGKSTLCELRLSILTGRPVLRNAPADLKDWHASVANSGGLHVTDNVQLLDKQLRQRLSDEICRIVTEPDPSIEQRKYYTNADLIRLPVRSVFAITAIQQPFQNSDLLQRAMLLELDKTAIVDGAAMSYDSEWKTQQIKRNGGREAWVAHHMVVLQKFFISVQTKWKNHYQAAHRLIHFEQAMCIMAEVLMPGAPTHWIPQYLMGMTNRVISENDWVLEGLIAFCTIPGHQSLKMVSAATIASWAEGEEDYLKCEMLVNSRRLGRYLKVHKGLVTSTTGLTEDRMLANRQTYKIGRVPKVMV